VAQQHVFEGRLRWTGGGEEVGGRLKLARAFLIEFDGKAPLAGSAPAVFGGDDRLHNPESLLVSAVMSCHHLTYLALCERAGVKLASYSDRATGTLAIKDGRMRMVEVVLRPHVTVSDPAQVERATALHANAHAHCFISNSVSADVRVEPSVTA
jgi:peroxiredoxin-like protein